MLLLCKSVNIIILYSLLYLNLFINYLFINYLFFFLGKALGLNDSDSEDEAPKRKSNKSTPSPPKPSPIENEIPKKSVEVFEIDDHSDKLQNNISTTAEYIAAAEALMAQPINKAQPQKKNINNAYTSKGDISLM